MLRAVNSEIEWSVLPETLNLGLMVHCCAAISTDVLMHQLSLASYSLHSTRLDTTRAAEVGLLSFLIGAEASTPPRAPTVLQSNCCWPHKKKHVRLCSLCLLPTVYVYIRVFRGHQQRPNAHCFTNAIFFRVLQYPPFLIQQLSVAFYIILHLGLLRN